MFTNKSKEVKPCYAVAVGRVPGVYFTWEECEAQVKGYSGAKYKKFHTMEEATNFITTHAQWPQSVQEMRDKIREEAEKRLGR